MNQTIYKDDLKNAIRISEVSKIEQEIAFNGLGIKYVAAGQETYVANNKRYLVKAGEYIIGNDFTASHVHIDHKSPVHGLCIDVSPTIIAEVASYHDVTGSNLKDFLLSDQFFVNRYNAKHTHLGYSLAEINNALQVSSPSRDLLQSELFYSLAEAIVIDQRLVFEHLKQLDFKKTSTNEEVLRALIRACEWMDDQLLEQLSLDQISAHVGISKYHFIRLFKSTFGVSPHQYQKRKRLERGKSELQAGRSIAETAHLVGYADVPTFSKAFKQTFGCAPSVFKK